MAAPVRVARVGARSRVGSSVARVRVGGSQVGEVQRARMLSSAVAVVSELGYQRMSVARVTRGAGVSRRTFYEVFEDREDCFLAVFEDALGRARERMLAGCAAGEGWSERVRGALGGLLAFFDEEPRLGSLLVVDALLAGPRVLARRAETLGELSAVLQAGGVGASGGRVVGKLTGEGLVGAVFTVLHTRLSRRDPGVLVELQGPLMGMIVLSYLGPEAAARESKRKPIARASSSRASSSSSSSGSGRGRSARRGDNEESADVAGSVVGVAPLADLPMRLTYRTLRVLRAVGELPGASNRCVGERAGTHDQGQISKLLARLECLGLIENIVAAVGGARPSGTANAWRLTARGEQIERATRSSSSAPAGRARPGGGGGK